MDIKALREEYNALRSDGEKFLASKSELTADDNEAMAKRFARMDQIKSLLDTAAKFAAYEFANGNVEKPRTEFVMNGDVQLNDMTPAEKRKSFGRAAAQWAVTGVMPQQFATITGATQSGILLPTSVAAPSVPVYGNAFRKGMALAGFSPMYTADTGNWNQPVMDASAGRKVTPGVVHAASDTNDLAPSLAHSYALNVYTYESQATWFQNQQLSAVNYDLLETTVPALQFGAEVGFEKDIIAGVLADSAVAEVKTAVYGVIDYNALVNLNRSLPAQYDFGKFIVLAKDAYASAEKLVGSDGQPILNRDAQNQELLRFNGTPVLRSDSFVNVLGASVPSDNMIGVIVSCGGFKIRDAATPKVLRYINSEHRTDQTGLNFIEYCGYGYASNAVTKLVNHY